MCACLPWRRVVTNPLPSLSLHTTQALNEDSARKDVDGQQPRAVLVRWSLGSKHSRLFEAAHTTALAYAFTFESALPCCVYALWKGTTTCAFGKSLLY
jgi:hypothetical protein